MSYDDEKKQITEAIAFLHDVALEGEGVSSNMGHALSMKMLQNVTTTGAKKGELKAIYRSGTAEERKDAAGVFVLLGKMIEQVLPLLTKVSIEEGDDFVKRVCTCGQCEGEDVIHMPPPEAGNILDSMPEELAKVLRDLMDNHGLTLSSSGAQGNYGFVELGGNEQAVKAAQKALDAIGAKGTIMPASVADKLSKEQKLAMHLANGGGMNIPKGILDAIDAQKDEPTDDHTSEISRALDRMGSKRPRLRRSDFPKPD